jgi:Ca-activated chloride channel family protein
MSHAFIPDKTNMYSGVREAVRLAKPFAAGSTTLIVISDGDTLPDSDLEAMPPAIADAMVLGVGDPYRASPVGDTASRQDTASLKQLAARLRGTYFDGNVSHLPSGILGELAMLSQEPPGGVGQRTLGLLAVGFGGGILAGLWPALAWYGMPRTVRKAARAVAVVDEIQTAEWAASAATIKASVSNSQAGASA